MVNVGLGSADAEMTLVSNPRNRSGGFVSVGGAGVGSIGHDEEKIKILRGDSYVEGTQLGPIDFIKIDVEGFERDVLTGLAQTIAQSKPVVTLELNHWCLNAFQRMSVPDFFDFLRSVFPVLYAVHVEDAKNLHDPAQSFFVMHEHIVGFKYMSIVGAFDESQIGDFLTRYVGRSPLFLRMEQQHKTDLRELAELRQEVHLHRAQIAELRGQIDVAQASEAALRNSKSWKATAPLRAVRRWFN